jgi:hypothetical protein
MDPSALGVEMVMAERLGWIRAEAICFGASKKHPPTRIIKNRRKNFIAPIIVVSIGSFVSNGRHEKE